MDYVDVKQVEELFEKLQSWDKVKFLTSINMAQYLKYEDILDVLAKLRKEATVEYNSVSMD